MMLTAARRDLADICWATEQQTAITGWCWLLRVRSGLRPDETYRWWFGETDLARRADAAGGATRVEAGVVHVHPNLTTSQSPELRELAEADRAVYVARWGG
jgi:hypothetical protein